MTSRAGRRLRMLIRWTLCAARPHQRRPTTAHAPHLNRALLKRDPRARFFALTGNPFFFFFFFFLFLLRFLSFCSRRGDRWIDFSGDDGLFRFTYSRLFEALLAPAGEGACICRIFADRRFDGSFLRRRSKSIDEIDRYIIKISWSWMCTN